MSEVGRRRSSKWDLPKGNKSHNDSLNSDQPSRMRSSFHDKDVPGRHRSNDAYSLKQDIRVDSRRISSGRRDIQTDETINEKSLLWDREGKYAARMSPGLDECRQRNRSRSPRNRIRSPRSSRSRSRSRSRSPGNKLHHESVSIEQSRCTSGVPQMCRDFTAGRCKRGNHCLFSHSDNQSYGRRHSESSVTDNFENRDRGSGVSRYSDDAMKRHSAGERSGQCCNDFLKGRCSRGASCKYAHHDATYDVKGSTDYLNKDGDNDIRRRGTYPSNVENSRSRGHVCKYFATGNCPHGKYCRYSHDLQEVDSPERPVEERRASNHNLVSVGQVSKGATWDDPVSDVSQAKGWPDEKSWSLDPTKPRETVWGPRDNMDVQNNNPDSVSQMWKGAAQDDTVDDVPKAKGWPEESENLEILRPTEIPQGSWNVDPVNESRTLGVELGSNDEKLSDGQKLQETVNDIGVSVTKSTENCFGAVGILTAQTCNSEFVSFPATRVQSGELNVIRHVTSGKQYTAGVSQHGVLDEAYSQNPTFVEAVSTAYPVQDNSFSSCTNSNTLASIMRGQDTVKTSNANNSVSGLNSERLDQPSVSRCTSDESGQITKNFWIHSDGPYMGDGNLPQPAVSLASIQGPGSCEKLMQSSDVSNALAQLMENNDLISQLYSAQHDAFDGLRCTPNSRSNVQRQRPLHFSTSLNQNPENKQGLSTANESMALVPPVSPATFRENEADQKQYDPICDSVDPKLPNADSPILSNVGPKSSSHGTSMPVPDIQPASTGTGAGSSDGAINNQSQTSLGVCRVDQKGNTAERTGEPVESAPPGKMATDGGADERKKGKDIKELRAFKFALADFVKELLKPSWKDGLVSKESYKTIVKKVVDKVVDTVQATHVPQTKEKIDHYLSFSKPKLSKLVQAYVEKHQKN